MSDKVETVINDKTVDQKGPTFKIGDLLKTADDVQNMMKTYLDLAIKEIQDMYHVSPELFDAMLPYTVDQIISMNMDTMNSIIRKYSYETYDDNFQNVAVFIPKTWELYSVIMPEDINEDDDDRIIPMMDDEIETVGVRVSLKTGFTEETVTKAILMDIKKKYLRMLSMKETKDEILKNINGVMDEANINGPSMVDTIRERLKKQYETTDDIKMKSELRDSMDYAFLWERLDLYGANERRRIKDIFISEKLSNYVIDRYKARCKQLGRDENLWTKFVSLEEKYVGEDFYPFNNLFLFVYMRWTANIDPASSRDKCRFDLVTRELVNLVYNYNKEGEEERIINTIKSVDSKFEEDKDWFIEKNINSPSNPEYIKKQQHAYDVRREKIKENYETLNLMSEWDESLNNDQLHDKITSYIESTTKEQLTEYNNRRAPIVKKFTNEAGETGVEVAPAPIEEEPVDVASSNE